VAVQRQERIDVDQSIRVQAKTKTEVSGPGLHPLPDLRQVARGVPQVQSMPDLFQNLGERRQDTGREEGQLVSRPKKPAKRRTIQDNDYELE
jgi:hypothetical protein